MFVQSGVCSLADLNLVYYRTSRFIYGNYHYLELELNFNSRLYVYI